MANRDLTGRTVIARAESRDPLGYVVRSGKISGAWGHWIVDLTGDPGSEQAQAHFADDWLVKLAIVGETVCTKDWAECSCPLAHVPADTRAALIVAAARAEARR